MSAPDFLPRTRAAGDLDDEQAWRELAAYRAYQAGCDAGPEAVELPPDNADVRYTGTWHIGLSQGGSAA